MFTFIARRLLSGILLLFVISTATFFLVYSTGSDIARNILGIYATKDQVAAKAAELGLDRAITVQYADWLSSLVLRGDLGRSWFTSDTVVSSILSRLPVTLSVVVLTITATAIVATFLGLTAAVKRGWLDRVLQVFSILGFAIPGFIVAVALVTILGVRLQLFPATGFIPITTSPGGWLFSLVLPVTSLVISSVASTAQQLRSSIIDVYRRDYVRTLRSRGLGELEILLKHVLRSAAPAGLTVISLLFVNMLGGSVFVEQIFALPGMGALAISSTTRGDLPVILGVVLFTVTMVIIVNLIVDLLIGWLNPKVRVR